MHSQKNTNLEPPGASDFTKLFPNLPPLALDDAQLHHLANQMVQPAGHLPQDSQVISNGLAIFGQFLAHDITFESTSNLSTRTPVAQLQNDRTIRLDLDCIYGQKTQSFYYDKADTDKLRLGQKYVYKDLSWYDLQRNRDHIAIIPDARNDENIIVSRQQVLFIEFHNRMVDYVREKQGTEQSAFREARRLTTWYYHWLILHEYLFKVIDWGVFHRILNEGCQYFTTAKALPLEFTGAAFRLGHSQTRELNRINQLTEKRLLDLGFFERMDEYVDWRYLFDFGDKKCQFAHLLDTQIGSSFHALDFIKKGEKSLPFLNLKRGVVYGLPAGEAVAELLGFEPITIRETESLEGTPLWFYILREAEMLGHGGEHLGPVGSTILGECFFTLLKKDHNSFLSQQPDWNPTIGRHLGRFDFVDMIKFTYDSKTALYNIWLPDEIKAAALRGRGIISYSGENE